MIVTVSTFSIKGWYEMRRIETLVSALCLSGLLAGCSAGSLEHNGPTASAQLHASWEYSHSSYQEILEKSDLTVLGTISAEREVASQDGIPFTTYTVKIGEVLSGDVQQDTVDLYMTGGVIDRVLFEIPEDPLPQLGEEFLLFLAVNEDGTYRSVGGPEGRVRYEEGLLYSLRVQDEQSDVVDPLSMSGESYTDFIAELGLGG